MSPNGRKGRLFHGWLFGVDEGRQLSHCRVAFLAPRRVIFQIEHSDSVLGNLYIYVALYAEILRSNQTARCGWLEESVKGY